MSFAEYLARVRDPKLRDEKSLAAMFVEGFDAAHVERVSAKSLASEQGQIGEDAPQFRLIGGYDALLRHLVADDVLRDSIQLSTLVTRLRWQRGRVEATDARGRRFTARRAIVTLPVALLQSPDDSRGAIRFEPEIDDTRRAACMLAAGPVVKVLLRFGEPFWVNLKTARLPRGQSLRDMSFIHWRDAAFPTWWTQLPLRMPILTAWAGGPKADALSGRGDAFIIGAAVRALSTITGVSVRRLASMLEDGRAADWQSDPLSRGAYSYVKVGGEVARAALARPVAQTLFFAGEATDTDGEAGTVAGALASGERAARQALRTLR